MNQIDNDVIKWKEITNTNWKGIIFYEILEGNTMAISLSLNNVYNINS